MATDRPHRAVVGEAVERLGRMSLRETSMEHLLQTVAELAVSVIPGDAETSVSLLIRGRPRTVASTDRLPQQLDERQYELGDGPCLHAARSGELTEITDARTEPRWPVYARRAADLGSLSSLSVPLVVDPEEQVTGALNVYARRAAAFDDSSRGAAAGFGGYAAIAAGNLHAYRRAHESAQHLQAALGSRAVIDQAKGILIERHRLTADEAFKMLADVSMRSNTKLRHVAEHLVSTGELLRP